MKLPLPLLAVSAAVVFAAPAFVSAQQNGESAEAQVEAQVEAEVTTETPAHVHEAPAPAEPAAEAPAAQPVEEEALICRHIRLDTASRRKTRVCRTEEGWRQLNQQR